MSANEPGASISALGTNRTTSKAADPITDTPSAILSRYSALSLSQNNSASPAATPTRLGQIAGRITRQSSVSGYSRKWMTVWLRVMRVTALAATPTGIRSNTPTSARKIRPKAKPVRVCT